MRWLAPTRGYTTLEPSTGRFGGRDIVRHDPEDRRNRDSWSRAELLIPPGESAPLSVDDYAFSADRSRLLIFTNSQRVWRTQHPRRLLGARPQQPRARRSSAATPRLPRSCTPSSPRTDCRWPTCARTTSTWKTCSDHRITQLTKSSSADEINGTFDWVYEEEFGLRDGFRWSPDGTSIAYWQLEYARVFASFRWSTTPTRSIPRINPIKYPKVGETNSACRVGVVSAAGGETRWLEVPGDPRNHYIAFMEWAGNSDEVILQQFNRHQNTVRVMLARCPQRPRSPRS